MKEKIVIKNFSVIDEVEIDIKKINLLIGPQATGKSVIAKLVYFFKTIKQRMYMSITLGERKPELNKKIRNIFARIFPDYFLKEKSYELKYYFDDQFITITNEKGKSYESIKISYSTEISNKFTNLLRYYKKESEIEKLNRSGSIQHLLNSISSRLDQFFYGTSPYILVFIPAMRSFFANLEKNIFSVLTQSTFIDYMLTEFGSFYEKIKEMFLSINWGKNVNAELYGICSELLRGEYQYRNKVEWIKTGENKLIFLRDSSSGQQEVAPLIVALMVLSGLPGNNFYMFIEEPEAHLFPESQRNIVEIIAMVYNLLNRNSGFFITTHSPYILTSFNNLIQVDNTYREIMKRFEMGKIDQKIKNDQIKRLDKIIKPNRRVSFDDAAVYVIKDGKCKDIRNNQNKLIDENVIDEVSGRIDSIFDQLIDILPGD
jgi:predicted ATPase